MWASSHEYLRLETGSQDDQTELLAAAYASETDAVLRDLLYPSGLKRDIELIECWVVVIRDDATFATRRIIWVQYLLQVRPIWQLRIQQIMVQMPHVIGMRRIVLGHGLVKLFPDVHHLCSVQPARWWNASQYSPLPGRDCAIVARNNPSRRTLYHCQLSGNFGYLGHNLSSSRTCIPTLVG